MHFSKNTPLPHALLAPTARHQYSRRLPTGNSHLQVDRVWRLLHQEKQSSRPQGVRVQTESRERSETRPEEDLEGMRRVAKLQAEALCRKQGGVWREVAELYERVKDSSSKELLARNDLAFLLKLTQAIRLQREEPARKKEEQPRNFQMEILKLEREVELLKLQLASNDHPSLPSCTEPLKQPSLGRVESSLP